MKRVDLTGNQYGKLTVNEMLYGVKRGGKKRTLCLCSCECGNECTVVSDRLSSGLKTSCGCDTIQRRATSNRVDLTNKRFGRLVVEEMLWDNRPTKALCKCDCGNTSVVISAQLTNGKTKSCGCLQKESTSNHNTKDWTGEISDYGIKLINRSVKNKTGQWLWTCECGLCQARFDALPAKVLSGHITSCGCRKRSSKEDLIRGILNSMGIDYIEQYRFADCKNLYTLPFDFAVFSEGRVMLLIEYDGKQHYTPVSIFGGQDGYNDTVYRDSIKNNYCKENNINLLRLPYTLTDSEIKQKILNAIYP